MNKVLAVLAFLPLLLTAFAPGKKNKLKLPAEFVLVPGGTTHNAPDTCCLHGETSPNRITVTSFYISKFETTNQQYAQFYNEVAGPMRDEEKRLIACDSLGWLQVSNNCESLVNYYYKHPAYNNYPVVNISHEGAIQYCAWLQKKLQAQNPYYEIEIKLPSKDQWIYAAQGGRSNMMYPWGNYYLRNKKGEFLCNFKRVGDQLIVRNRQTGKPEVKEISTASLSSAFYTAAVKSFYPNDFGIYNFSGNVAELISEKGIAMGGSWNDYGGDVQIRSEASYTGSSPTIGFRPIIIVKEKKKD